MLAYYCSIAEATRLGMLIYSGDWANFSEAVVERLSSIPNLVTWKDGRVTFDACRRSLMDLAGLRGGPVWRPLVGVSDLEKDELQELRDILDSWKPFLD